MPRRSRVKADLAPDLAPGDEVRMQGTTAHGFLVAVGKEDPRSPTRRVLVWKPNCACYHDPKIVEMDEFEVDKV